MTADLVMDTPVSDPDGLLVRALLASDREAVDFWKRWKLIGDLDTVGGSAFAVLPLLYRKLRRLLPQDDVVRRLGSVYRQSVYRNKLTASRLQPILLSMASRDIPALLLSGVALSEFYVAPTSVRPYQVVQLAVRPENLGTLVRIVEEQGWSREDSVALRALRMGSCHRFRHAQGFDLELCSSVLWESPGEVVNDHFWDNTMQVELEGAPALVLEPHAQLTHVCVRTLASMGDTELLSFVDAAQIIGSESRPLDLNRLVLFTQSTLTVERVRARLRELLSLSPIPHAESILSALERLPVSSLEMREYRMSTRTSGALGRLPWMWSNFKLRVRKDRQVGFGAFGFLGYLGRSFGLETVGGLPRLVLRKLLDKLRSRPRDS